MALPAYYTRANPDLLCRIPDSAQTVLEVGCGGGTLGAAYKAINPQATYIGFELDANAAAEASTRLDHVVRIDVEADTILEAPISYNSIDCLVYGDVLEHLKDPEAVLRKHLDYLSEDGLVLACVPNVQHWSSLVNLLNGRWPQDDQGLFDRTHLRWFTKDGIVELMQKCGLIVHDITPRIFDAGKAMSVLDKLSPALPGLNINPKELLAGISPLQYVLRAGRQRCNPLVLSGLMIRPQAGMQEVRMLQPLQALGSRPGVVVETSDENLRLLPADSNLPRVMIWQRQSLAKDTSLSQIRQAINAGYILISEFDDDPKRWPKIEVNQHLTFTGMHAVQVSTEALATIIRPHNQELEIFENTIRALPDLSKKPWPEAEDNQPLRLFFGALNRGNDWAPWISALNQLLAEDPDGWEIEVVHDRAFFDALSTTAKRFTPTCAYTRYQELMGHCHVAFLPLADTRFNRMKSDLKFIEAASHGLAVLASPVVYDQTLIPGQTGELFNSSTELLETLRSWRKNPSQAKQLGLQARSYVRQHRMQAQQTTRREAWYRSLWQRREELTAALLQRVPELQELP